MNSKCYKYCAVPQCRSTTMKTPEKLFIHVPLDKKGRKKWLQLARRDPAYIAAESRIYFCEDHFDLPNDMENYMKYHIMGSVPQVRMKPNCVPTKFECQPDRRKRTSSSMERPYIQKRKRMWAFEECVNQSRKSSTVAKECLVADNTPSGSSDMHTVEEHLQSAQKTIDKSISVVKIKDEFFDFPCYDGEADAFGIEHVPGHMHEQYTIGSDNFDPVKKENPVKIENTDSSNETETMSVVGIHGWKLKEEVDIKEEDLEQTTTSMSPECFNQVKQEDYTAYEYY